LQSAAEKHAGAPPVPVDVPLEVDDAPPFALESLAPPAPVVPAPPLDEHAPSRSAAKERHPNVRHMAPRLTELPAKARSSSRTRRRQGESGRAIFSAS
jgi:hypothetical protein